MADFPSAASLMRVTSDGTDDDGDAAASQEMAAYLDALAAGERPDRTKLLAANPALAEFFAEHDRLAGMGSWWRAATGERAASGTDAAARGSGRDADPSVVLPALPGYCLLREIARGGMGVVYEARQEPLNRTVAIKLILQGALASSSDRRRFSAEAAAAARLKHPNIVVIHEVGEHAGQPYFSMEHVAGESLSRVIRRELPTPKVAARYAADVANAVHYAHEQGVLHRDIKPSNVLIDEAGRVRVMDFGLAKQLDTDDKLTVTGQLLGTPSYMAPEQITRGAEAAGPACDIFGLGALLYELITGQPPFREASPVETLLAVLESDPVLPRRVNPGVPRELEIIALKCLEKDPSDRYASAGAVAADLERYLQGESLSISSPHLLDRLVRTLERSQFDREVYLVSRMVLHVAWIALAAHTLVFVIAQLRVAHPAAWVVAVRTGGVSAMLAVLWWRRSDWYPPRGPAARQLLALWIGYLLGTTAIVTSDLLRAPAGEPYYGLTAYPSMAALASLAFMVLGSSYWGYCYVIAGVFLLLAVVMAVWLPAAPLLFGFCWSASLVLLTMRLRRVSRAR